MSEKSISSSVLGKIREENILQYSRGYFLFRWGFMVISGILFFFLGVLASAVIWNFLHDPELLEIFSMGRRDLFMKFFLLSFPIFWLLLSIFLGVFVSFFARNTKKGYRFSYKFWFLVIISGQILMGLALEQSPAGVHLEHQMTREIHMMKFRNHDLDNLRKRPDMKKIREKIRKKRLERRAVLLERREQRRRIQEKNFRERSIK